MLVSACAVRKAPVSCAIRTASCTTRLLGLPRLSAWLTAEVVIPSLLAMDDTEP